MLHLQCTKAHLYQIKSDRSGLPTSKKRNGKELYFGVGLIPGRKGRRGTRRLIAGIAELN